MIYFDTSFVLPLIRPETTSEQVETLLFRRFRDGLAISHWTTVEVASALAKEVRMRNLTSADARTAETQFDMVVSTSFTSLLPSAQDYDLARHYLQNHTSGLRSGDALHMAVATNNKADAIYTLDKVFLKIGRGLGLRVETLPARS